VTFISELDRQAVVASLKLSTASSGNDFTRLLRPSLPAHPAVAEAGSVPGWADRSGIVFLGSGPNPSNHLSVQWLLLRVWPELRRRLPRGTRLHIVGERPEVGGQCTARRVHCGWLWGTPYVAATLANFTDAQVAEATGVVVHGRLQLAQLDAVLDGSRVFLAPIVCGTGVNTKSLQVCCQLVT
jgi:hypothetical protein